MATEVSPDVVGNAFVYQYYHILHQSPELVHRFYQDVSKLGRPDGLGMSTTTTMHAINEKILSLGYGEFVAEIASVDSQESYNGGVLVLVTGHLTGSDNVRQKFSQSFFLAPQEKGYFVLNDVFRYVDDTKGESGSQDHVNNADAPVTVTESSSIREVYIAEAATTVHEEVKEEEVYNPAENGDGSVEDEEVPVPEVVDEIPDDSQVGADKQLVVESNNKNEELPKKSYASIVKVLKGNSSLFSTPTPSPIKSAPPKPQEPVNSVLSTPSATETHDSSSNANGIGNAHDVEEGPSIYVKGLPSDATPALLERIFKTFGPIRPGGIQVRFVKGFSFGFVEFEVASAVQSALEASPIMINGCRVVVEEKKSTSRGNRGRYPYGSGNGFREGSGNGYREGSGTGYREGSGTGYREGGRGRGNYGSKAYGQGDFSSRGEFGNRGNSRGGYSSRGGGGGYSSRGGEGGGYSSRGGEGGGYSSRGGEGGGYSSRGGEGGGYANRGGEGGYRRADKMGNNGGRNKPLNGAAVAKTTAPQVSATA